MQVKLLGLSISTDTNNIGYSGAQNESFDNIVAGQRYRIIAVATDSNAVGGNPTAGSTAEKDAFTSVGAVKTTTTAPITTPTAGQHFLASAAGTSVTTHNAGATVLRVSDKDVNRSNVDNARCVLVQNGSEGKRVVFLTKADGTVVGSFSVPRYSLTKLVKDADQMVWAAQGLTGAGSQASGVTFTSIAFTD